jgi:hypothetical protein
MAKRTVTQLIDAVVLKDNQERADIETGILAWINEAYFKIARRNLKCFEDVDTFNITSATNIYAIDTIIPGCRKIIILASASGEIKVRDAKKNIESFNSTIISLSSGYPTIAWDTGNKLYFNAIPDTTYSITAYYFIMPDAVTLGTPAEYLLIPAVYEDLVINYAKAIYDFKAHNYKAVDRAKAEFESELRKWEVEEHNKRFDNYAQIMELQEAQNMDIFGKEDI